MKKIVIITLCLALIAAVTLSVVACGITDEFSKFEKVFESGVKTLETAEEGKTENQGTAELVQSRILFGAETEELPLENEPTLLSKVEQALGYWQSIKDNQVVVDEGTIAIKETFAALKENYKLLKESGLGLTPEEKQYFLDKALEAAGAKDAIEGTIEKVYKVIGESRSLFKFSTIDQALPILLSASENMQIRTSNVVILRQIVEEANAMLVAKIAEIPAE